MKSLSDVQNGALAEVEHVGGERAVRRRLMELGLLAGTRVQVLGRAPWGDPLKIRFRGTTLSIRATEAAAIRIQMAPATSPAQVPSAPVQSRGPAQGATPTGHHTDAVSLGRAPVVRQPR
jgi:ferrous iron transport protein A